MLLHEGEVIDLDRHKFKVGPLAAHGAMSSLYKGTCTDGKSKGAQVSPRANPLLLLVPFLLRQRQRKAGLDTL